jgi:hypothetical protein
MQDSPGKYSTVMFYELAESVKVHTSAQSYQPDNQVFLEVTYGYNLSPSSTAYRLSKLFSKAFELGSKIRINAS